MSEGGREERPSQPARENPLPVVVVVVGGGRVAMRARACVRGGQSI
jgi:hypothetical protein